MAEGCCFLLEREREGSLRIVRFSALTDERRESDRRTIPGTIRNRSLLDAGTPMALVVRETFLGLWREAARAGRP